MASTGMLVPASLDLAAVIGADFSTTIVLYQDLAQTQPFDLSGYTVTLTIGGFILTVGSGLTISNPTNGTILAQLTAVQTQTVGLVPLAYNLNLVDPSGVVSVPLHGHVGFVTP
jgi:hypothetical protein